MDDKVIPFSLSNEREIIDALCVVGERYGLHCDYTIPFERDGFSDDSHTHALGCNYAANYLHDHPRFEEKCLTEENPSLPEDLGDFFIRCINGGVSLVSDRLVSSHEEDIIDEDWLLSGSVPYSHLYRYGCAVSAYYCDVVECFAILMQDVMGRESLSENYPQILSDYRKCCLRCVRQMKPPKGETWPLNTRIPILAITLVRYGIWLYCTFYGFDPEDILPPRLNPLFYPWEDDV